VTNKTNTKGTKNWSAGVTRESNALDLEEGVFTWNNPARIAQSLKNSADNSKRRKSSPYRSAMSMLVFYINRAGRHLDEEQKQILEQAKTKLRKLYGREKLTAKTQSAQRKRK
jgi:hemerythrin-like domain-containing protein